MERRLVTDEELLVIIDTPVFRNCQQTTSLIQVVFTSSVYIGILFRASKLCQRIFIIKPDTVVSFISLYTRLSEMTASTIHAMGFCWKDVNNKADDNRLEGRHTV